MRASRPDGLVARAAHGADRVGTAELAAQLRDVDVDGARAARVAHPPDAVEQLVARDDDAGVLEQVGEEIELLAGQLDELAGDPDLARLRVDRDVAELEQLRRAWSGSVRRRTALTRAASSRGEKGFET